MNADAVKVARNSGVDRVVLYLHGGSSWSIRKEEVPAAVEVKTAPPAESPAVEVVPESVPAEEPKLTKADGRPQGIPASTDEVFGIPRDMILPASIGALAVVIIAVFTISRLSD